MTENPPAPHWNLRACVTENMFPGGNDVSCNEVLKLLLDYYITVPQASTPASKAQIRLLDFRDQRFWILMPNFMSRAAANRHSKRRTEYRSDPRT